MVAPSEKSTLACIGFGTLGAAWEARNGRPSILTAIDLPLVKLYFADIFLISESLSVTDTGIWNSALPSILSRKNRA
jgi:hypothetical protein